MKRAGKTNKVVMETLGIKNVSQIYTWMRWYANEELHHFNQPVGKQYKGLEQLSEVEQLRLQVELLKKYRSLVRQSPKKPYKLVEEYKKIYPVSVILDCFGVNRSIFFLPLESRRQEN